MFIMTCRDIEPEEAPFLHELLLDLSRSRLRSHIKLPRLACEETKELLSILFAGQITSEFLDIIFRHTEGNPFFIEEVCKALVEDGKLFFADGHWHHQIAIDELEIPPTIRVAIQSRVRVLPEYSQETLNLAAVLGREFDFYTLAKASDLEEEFLQLGHLAVHVRQIPARPQLVEELVGPLKAAQGVPVTPVSPVDLGQLLQRLRSQEHVVGLFCQLLRSS